MVLVRVATGQTDLGSEMDHLEKETDNEEEGLGNEEQDGECADWVPLFSA